MSIYTAAAGPSEVRLGFLQFSASTTHKPLLVGVLCAALAIWLSDRLDVLGARSARAVPWLPFVAFGAGLVALAAPMAATGFVLGHDVTAHATYSFLFERALSQGQFPVRWVEWVEPGRGQPLFNHYQVGLYYLVSLVHAVGVDLAAALKVTVIGVWWSGAGFMYLLCRPLGRMPGLLAAAVFAWSPYLLLDTYVRAAYPEMAAIGFLPAVFWSLDRSLRRGRVVHLAALAPAVALVLVCHPPTAVIALPLAPLYAIALLLSGETTVRRVAAGALAGTFGAGLAAFYVVPAVLELEHVSIGRMTSGYFDYRLHFVQPRQWFDYQWGVSSSAPGPDDGLSLQVGKVQWAMAVAGLVAVVGACLHGRWRRVAALAWWLGVFGFALFMTSGASSAVWGAAAPLAFVQFPWRFLMLIAMASGVLGALALSAIPGRTAQALVVLCVITTQWHVTRHYVATTLERERLVIGIGDPGWPLTENARDMAFQERAYDPLGSEGHAYPLGRWALVDGRGSVRARTVRDDRMSLDASTAEGFELLINSRYVPGWRVWLDGRDVALDGRPGPLRVAVPPGITRVEARYTATPVRAFANATSLAAAAMWLILGVAGWWRGGAVGGRPRARDAAGLSWRERPARDAA